MVHNRVKQGDATSPELFTLFFDRIYPYLVEYYNTNNVDAATRHTFTIASLQLFALAFADDLVLIAPSPLALQHLLNHFIEFCQENDLELNVGKTKAMFVNCNG